MSSERREHASIWWGTSLLVLVVCAWGICVAVDAVYGAAHEAAGRSAVVVGRPAAGPPPTTVAPSAPLEVVFWGDSLGWESRNVVTSKFAGRADVHVDARTFGGTAPCDWFIEMSARAATIDVALLQFSGNAFSNCMRDPVTQALPVAAGIVAKYERDVEFIAQRLTALGARVVLVGSPPPRRASPGDPSLTLPDMYRSLAARLDRVAYVDAGQAVLDRGAWTATLPCLPFEDTSRGCRDGHIPVRAPDGAHLCPVATPANEGVVGECAAWSSGAFRYGSAIADAIARQVAALVNT